MTLLAVIGVKALWLLYLWLASAIVASYLSNRKGYGEKPGLASGMLLSAVGIVIWLLWPARADSAWKRDGPIGRRSGDREPDAAASGAAAAERQPAEGGGASSSG